MSQITFCAELCIMFNSQVFLNNNIANHQAWVQAVPTVLVSALYQSFAVGPVQKIRQLVDQQN